MTDAIGSIPDGEVAVLAREAEAFLSGHAWCGSVVRGRKVWAVPGVLGIFHFDVIPTAPDVDASVWVVVGDLPPAYIAQPPDASWRDVLAGYVFEMRRWTSAVRAAQPIEQLIPVNVPPRLEYAELLERRLSFIDSQLLAVPIESLEGTG